MQLMPVSKLIVSMTIWALLLTTGFLIASHYAPHRTLIAVLIPCLFLAIFFPMVLLRSHNKR